MPSAVINDYLAGAIGGLAGLVIGHPFDTTKVRYQVEVTSKDFSGCVRNIHADGMVKGFFRGMSIPLLSYGLVNSVLFGVYGSSLKVLTNGREDTPPKYSEIFLASFCGGVAQLIPACPVEVIKCALQSQAGNISAGQQAGYYKGPWSCCKTIFKKSGLRGFYKGLPVQAVRDLPASSIYFPTDTFLNKLLADRKWADKGGYVSSFLAGGMAGVASWVLIIPFDVIKSRLQSDIRREKYNGVMDCIVKSYRSGGIKIFFRGALMCAFRAFPVNAATLLVYHKTLRFLNGDVVENSL